MNDLPVPLPGAAWAAALLVLPLAACRAAPAADAGGGAAGTGPIRPLTVQGEHFVDADGKPVRFWGVNLVAAYPGERAQADAIADRLAERGVNLARPHHMMRSSGDWAPDLPGAKALLAYDGNSVDFEPVALERFDYLNAALRRRGIYLALTLHGTRRFVPGDADIVESTPEEAEAWKAAIADFETWPWQRAFDSRKMLPVVDERCARVMERFARQFLAHVNPHTGLAYGADPQVLYLEIVNEHSSEYNIVCGNRFPGVIAAALQARWEAFARENGLDGPGDLYAAEGKARGLRSRFLRGLDEAYARRIAAAAREAGFAKPILFSNLWRGDAMARLNADFGDVVEDHAYADPQVAAAPGDFVGELARSALWEKPFFVGELNQSERHDRLPLETPYRAQMPLAAAAYGSLQGWSGIVWFAWNHGLRAVGADGRAAAEDRERHIGDLVADGMLLDHLRATGLIFREGLVARARETAVVQVREPYGGGDYERLMKPQALPQPGWANVHAIRKSFAGAPSGGGPRDLPFKTPPAVLASDTGEIVKDPARRQLTVSAPRVEAFSGVLDGAAPANLPRLGSGDGARPAVAGWFGTVVAVAADGAAWGEARRLVVSRTWIDPEGREGEGFAVTLSGLPGGEWRRRITRPGPATAGAAPETETPVVRDAAGALVLDGVWGECELFRP